MNFKPSMLGNPKNKIPIMANGIWPRTTEVILKNLSSDPFKTKFQVACRKAANKTAIIMNVSIIKYLYSIRLILLIYLTTVAKSFLNKNRTWKLKVLSFIW